MSSRAATRVFQGVEEQIATGQLKDGAKLDEASLAERFEVSRTPVREALLQLVGCTAPAGNFKGHFVFVKILVVITANTHKDVQIVII